MKYYVLAGILLFFQSIASAQVYSDGDLDILFQKEMKLHSGGIHLLGDQNDDGYEDILVENWDYDPRWKSDRPYYEIYFGGNPMDTIPDLRWVRDFQSAAVLDCNNDGYKDIVCSFFDLKVYFGGPQLDTIPDQVIEHPLGEEMEFLAFEPNMEADYNGDGLKDFVAYSYEYPYGYVALNILFLYSIAEGEVSPTPASSLTFAEDSISIKSSLLPALSSQGDLNNDGRSDMSIHTMSVKQEAFGNNWRQYSSRLIYYGNNDLIFDVPQRFDGGKVGFDTSQLWIIPDINGDGYDDILTGDYRQLYYPYYYGYMIMKGGNELDTIPDFGFNALNQILEYPVPIGDFNGDGYNDLSGKLSGTGIARIWLGSSHFYQDPQITIFGPPESDVFFGNAIAAAGDVNGDGFDDIFIGSASTGSNPKRGTAVIYGGNSSLVSVEESSSAAKPSETFVVTAPHPNPFNSTTTIKLHLPSPAPVTMIVFDSIGQQIVNVERNFPAGEQAITFNAEQYMLSSGVYFAQFIFTTKGGTKTQTVKMQYLK